MKTHTEKQSIEEYVNRQTTVVNTEITSAIEEFFAMMNTNDRTTNQDLVRYLENVKQIKITQEIKTDVVLETVRRLQNNTVKRTKIDPSNKYSKWIYVKQ